MDQRAIEAAEDVGFGGIARHFREMQGLSQSEVASGAGISASTVSRLESNEERSLSARNVAAVLHALGFSLADAISVAEECFPQRSLYVDAVKIRYGKGRGPAAAVSSGPYARRWRITVGLGEVNVVIENLVAERWDGGVAGKEEGDDAINRFLSRLQDAALDEGWRFSARYDDPADVADREIAHKEVEMAIRAVTADVAKLRASRDANPERTGLGRPRKKKSNS